MNFHGEILDRPGDRDNVGITIFGGFSGGFGVDPDDSQRAVNLFAEDLDLVCIFQIDMEYRQPIGRTQADAPQAVRNLLPRLRDPAYTRVLIVTLPEATPVHEAERLQADLRRAGIEPYAWVINQSLLASDTRDPVLLQRSHCEVPYIERVVHESAHRCALIAWQSEPPVGARALGAWAASGPEH